MAVEAQTDRAGQWGQAPQTYEALVGLDQAYLLHPQHHPADHAAPVIFARGEGAILWDVQGRRYIDGLSCLWNVNVGHGRRELAEAGARQMERLAFANAYAGSSNEPAITLAARLAGLTPPGLRTTFFTTGGAESNDTAIKTARFYWSLRGQPEKTKVLSRLNGYHGVTMGSMGATALPVFHPRFGPLPPHFRHVPPMDAGALETAILEEGAGTVAAVIAEPVQGAGGVYPPPADYFPRLREICDRHDVLFIADEVITGFGRTGTFWGLQQWGVTPDILSFAKGITSGYLPLGGVIFSDAIRDVLYGQPPDVKWMHAYTYSAHPTCCAVAHANLDIIEREGLVERAARLGARLQERLGALAGRTGVQEVRGLGMMGAVELQPGAIPGSAGAVVAELKRRGVFTRYRNDTVMLAPPLVIAEAELEELADTLAATLADLLP
ncbi:MAG TPA: aspartate aminotransferase family protein [Chloroflexota bacterium]|nr:aspartate aminotransferase family protein [Chloroflexota bacterium]